MIHASYSSPVGQDDVVFATAIQRNHEPASATASAGGALIQRHEVVHFVPDQRGGGVLKLVPTILQADDPGWGSNSTAEKSSSTCSQPCSHSETFATASVEP